MEKECQTPLKISKKLWFGSSELESKKSKFKIFKGLNVDTHNNNNNIKKNFLNAKLLKRLTFVVVAVQISKFDKQINELLINKHTKVQRNTLWTYYIPCTAHNPWQHAPPWRTQSFCGAMRVSSNNDISGNTKKSSSVSRFYCAAAKCFVLNIPSIYVLTYI